MITIHSKSTKEHGGYTTNCDINLDGTKTQIACEIAGILEALDNRHPNTFAMAIDLFLSEKEF